MPLQVDPDRQIDRAVGNPPLLLDPHQQRVQVEDEVELLQRPILPGPDCLNHALLSVRVNLLFAVAVRKSD